MRTPTTKKTLFFVDNGALLCTKHLGATAAATGRDISGQKIHRISAAEYAELCKMVGKTVDCETCSVQR